MERRRKEEQRENDRQLIHGIEESLMGFLATNSDE